MVTIAKPTSGVLSERLQPSVAFSSASSVVQLVRIPVANRTLFTTTDRSFGTIAADFEQFMPRGWPSAARGIVGEVRRQ
jgi:hypothetical protein